MEFGEIPRSRLVKESKHLNECNLGNPPANRKLVQFLENDGKVLRFKGYWDDNTLYGQRIYFVIHFFLSDNSVEINEAHCRNSGRDPYPVFYKRGPLLKENRINAYPGMLEPDPIPYGPTDFELGQPIFVWGRKVMLYDCDDFTQDFYKGYLGIDLKKGAIDVTEPPIKHYKLAPPPHNGIGHEEDSLMNVMMVQPKPAKQDLVRLMTLSGEILRFEAKMVNGQPEDEIRKFVIGFFPADDQVAVWEINQRNSGFWAGKFREKTRTKNPDTGTWFKMTDLAIGMTVTISSQPFNIIRADEHSLNFLEAHPDQYPYADPSVCAEKLIPVLGEPEFEDSNGIDPDRLKDIAASAGIDLIDHEIITLLRAFPVDELQGVPMIAGRKISALFSHN